MRLIQKFSISQYVNVTKLFGEDGAKIQPDEFFLIFDNFLMAFNEAKIENETLRKKKAEEEKRLKVRRMILTGFESKRAIFNRIGAHMVLSSCTWAYKEPLPPLQEEADIRPRSRVY